MTDTAPQAQQPPKRLSHTHLVVQPLLPGVGRVEAVLQGEAPAGVREGPVEGGVRVGGAEGGVVEVLLLGRGGGC